jgi:hypothetical protein
MSYTIFSITKRFADATDARTIVVVLHKQLTAAGVVQAGRFFPKELILGDVDLGSWPIFRYPHRGSAQAHRHEIQLL